MGFFQQAVRSLKGASPLPPGEVPSQGLSPVFSFDFLSWRHRMILQVLWPEASFFPLAVSFSLPVPDPFPVLACFPPYQIRISECGVRSMKGMILKFLFRIPQSIIYPVKKPRSCSEGQKPLVPSDTRSSAPRTLPVRGPNFLTGFTLYIWAIGSDD